MMPSIQQFAHECRRDFPFKSGRVLEVGSCDVNGTIRSAFADSTEYIGIDQAAGPCVDRVMSANAIFAAFGPASFDTVACCEMLEHDPTPWVTVEQLRAVLKPGGHMLVTTPTVGFAVHRYPKDYFRYLEDAYREWIFRDMAILRLQEAYSVLMCLGRK